MRIQTPFARILRDTLKLIILYSLCVCCTYSKPTRIWIHKQNDGANKTNIERNAYESYRIHTYIHTYIYISFRRSQFLFYNSRTWNLSIGNKIKYRNKHNAKTKQQTNRTNVKYNNHNIHILNIALHRMIQYNSQWKYFTYLVFSTKLQKFFHRVK